MLLQNTLITTLW